MGLQLTDFFPINRGGTPGTAGSGTNFVATITNLASFLFASPSLSGTPTAPTAAAGNNSQQLSTTAFVASAVSTAMGTVASGTYVNKGSWDASAGTFPAGAQNGWVYLCSVTGAVGGKQFNVGDSIIANVNNASTTVFAGNWMEDLGGITSTQVLAAIGYTPAPSMMSSALAP